MLARRSVIALASITLVSAPVLAACSGSSDAQSSSSMAASSMAASMTPSVVASPSESLIGADPSTWAPVEITQAMNGDKLALVVGQVANFTDLPPEDANNMIVLRAKTKGVVDISQATKTSTAGFSAVAPGKTRVRVWDGKPKNNKSQVIMYVVVTVTEAPAATS